MIEENDLSMKNKIKQQLLEAWQIGHGGSASKVHLLQGEDGIVFFIPKALYQAEYDLQRKAMGGGRVLYHYLKTLLETVASDFQPLIEDLTDRAVDEIVPLIDMKAGWAIAFYRFKDNL